MIVNPRSLIYAFCLAVSLVSWATLALAQTTPSQPEIAFTFNGLPAIADGAVTISERKIQFQNFLTLLERERIKVTGFALAGKLNELGYDALMRFATQGHNLGNYTYTYPDFNKTSALKFIADVEKAEEEMNVYFFEHKFFRFPYDHSGNNLAKVDSVRLFLKKKNYKIAPATIDVDDWYFNLYFIEAKRMNNQKRADSIGIAYLEHINKRVQYFKRLSNTLLDRQVKHILQLEMNYINSIYLKDVIAYFKTNNWKIIELNQALQDPFYTLANQYVGETNLNCLERISSNTSFFTLNDFYNASPLLTKKVNDVFNAMTDKQRAGQMVVQAVGRFGKTFEEINILVQKQALGGVLLLNGTKNDFTKYVKILNETAAANKTLPLIYSADAEPSLINRKIQGTTLVKKAVEIENVEDCRRVTISINRDLKDIGISHNYAPVCDLTPSNEAIGNRSFGDGFERVTQMSEIFISTTQQMGIAATAKHFPGHGYVKGDTHSKLVYIDGELDEVPVYKPLIESGVISIMIAHIAVQNNEKYDTKGLPATCSRKIVTQLLKNEMGFKGIVITDAMNMGAVKNIEAASFKAVKAGCDMVLMPLDELELIGQIVAEMQRNDVFREQIYVSTKKIIRMKLCLGLIDLKS